jgi:DNA-binding MarR family transcriptional regulator
MSAIAKKMGHSTAAATGLVDRLEKLGFVERVHAAEDRRKIMVRITSSGSEIVSTMRQHIASELANIMEDLDDVDASSVVAANQAIEGKNLES